MMMADKRLNVFEVDLFRQHLAKAGQLKELEDTYSGGYPEISDISTAKKWDVLADCDCIPEVRIKRLERVVSLIDTKKKILDVGVGWGDIIPVLQRYNPHVDYAGIDFSKVVVEHLSAKYPEPKFLNTIIENIEEKYDVILVLEVLEHIIPSKTLQFLKEVCRVLKDDGTLIVDVPINEDLKNNTFICGKCGSYVNKMGHVRDYSVELIKAELEFVGFTVIYTEFLYGGYYGIKGAIKRVVRNFLGSLVGPTTFKKVQPGCVILKCKKKR